MPFYEKGDVRIHYEEAGSGFPLLVIPGGGLNSTIAGLATKSHPFNAFDEFKDEYRCIAADLRNANGGQSSGPAGGRPAVGCLYRRSSRPDGSPRHRQVPGAGLLHRRPVHLEHAAARAGPRGRRRAGAAERLPPRDARTCSTRTTSRAGDRLCATAGPTSRWRWSMHS